MQKNLSEETKVKCSICGNSISTWKDEYFDLRQRIHTITRNRKFRTIRYFCGDCMHHLLAIGALNKEIAD